MNKKSKVSGLILVLSFLPVAGSAVAENEAVVIKTYQAREVSSLFYPLTVAINAYKNAITADEKLAARQDLMAAVTAAILSNPENAVEATSAAITAAPDLAGPITLAAKTAAPQQSNAIITAALSVPGVNPTDVTAPSAAGPESNRAESNGSNENRGEFGRPSVTPSSSGGGGSRRTASPA